MRVATFNKLTHYEIVKKWWAAHEWNVIPPRYLPLHGFIVFDDETPICAAWIYRTDSLFALLEYVVANPEVKGERRAKGLDMLIASAKYKAHELGHKSIFMSTDHELLIKRLKKHGFDEQNKGMSHLFCNLGKEV